MTKYEPFLWMSGNLATELVEIRHDLEALNEGGFWAVMVEFDGGITCGRFAQVLRETHFPHQSAWQPLSGKWTSTLNKSEYLGYVESIRQSTMTG